MKIYNLIVSLIQALTLVKASDLPLNTQAAIVHLASVLEPMAKACKGNLSTEFGYGKTATDSYDVTISALPYSMKPLSAKEFAEKGITPENTPEFFKESGGGTRVSVKPKK